MCSDSNPSLRFRKEKFFCFEYIEGMRLIFDAQITVEQVLAARPGLTAFFINLKTDCVGCPMQKFCTLADVANSYAIPIDTLLEKISEQTLNQRRML